MLTTRLLMATSSSSLSFNEIKRERGRECECDGVIGEGGVCVQ